AIPMHAHTGSEDLLIVPDHIPPHTIRAAPLRRRLPPVLPRPTSNLTEPIDRRLNGPLRHPVVAVLLPTRDHVNLPRERVQPRPLRLMEEHLQVAARRVLHADLRERGELLRRPRLLVIQHCKLAHFDSFPDVTRNVAFFTTTRSVPASATNCASCAATAACSRFNAACACSTSSCACSSRSYKPPGAAARAA